MQEGAAEEEAAEAVVPAGQRRRWREPSRPSHSSGGRVDPGWSSSVVAGARIDAQDIICKHIDPSLQADGMLLCFHFF